MTRAATRLSALAVAVLALLLFSVPARAEACNVTVPVGGSVETAVNAAAPGSFVCLRGGVHADSNREFRITARGSGTAGGETHWITVRSYPGELATLSGRLNVTSDSTWVRFTRLVLDGSGGPPISGSSSGERLPSPTVQGRTMSFVRVEVTNRHTGICFDEGMPQWGQASDLRIRYSLIHDCGASPPTNHQHGIYLEAPTSRAQITDNWIYDNADRCVQMYPNADDAYVAYNVIDGCGEGVMFAGADENGFCAASDRNVVEKNVIANARVRWLVEAWWGCGAVGTGNVVRANCLWPTNPDTRYRWNSGLDGSPGYAAQDNLVADPAYVDGASKDFRLRSDSACQGKGPRVIPGP
jgi:hypothetical protein